MNCDRCKIRAIAFRMSFFNTQQICEKCDAIERAHPMYAYAREVEASEVEKGNYSFEGIGLPPDLEPDLK